MARMTGQGQEHGSKRETGSHKPAPSGVGSPISNEAYNVISALHAKLEGLEAYRKYAKDADSELWRELTANDVQNVRTLCDELERLVREDKLRMHEPGRANAE